MSEMEERYARIEPHLNNTHPEKAYLQIRLGEIIYELSELSEFASTKDIWSTDSADSEEFQAMYEVFLQLSRLAAGLDEGKIPDESEYRL